MKNPIFKSILIIGLVLFISQVNGQQLDIEINETNKAGIQIRNLNTSNASATNLDFRNDVNSLFQLGITGSKNSFFNFQEEVAYLFTLGGQDIPIAFATNGKERMRIDSEGRVGIGRNNSLSSLVSIYNDDAHKGRDALFIYQDSANSAIDIISNANYHPALQIEANDWSAGANIFADSSYALTLRSENGASSTLSAVQNGLGSCARFSLANSMSNSAAVSVISQGNASALSVDNNGNGAAGRFKSSSPLSTLDVQNTGTGHSLFVRGTALRQDADPNWDTTSDRRLKKDVKKFEDGLDVVMAINPVFFRYNGLCGISPEKENVGIIAQEIAEVAPYMVTERDMLLHPEDLDNKAVMEDVMTYNPTALPYILVNAVKTLNLKISDQERVIIDQNKTTQDLEDRLEKLENLIVKNAIQ